MFFVRLFFQIQAPQVEAQLIALGLELDVRFTSTRHVSRLLCDLLFQRERQKCAALTERIASAVEERKKAKEQFESLKKEAAEISKEMESSARKENEHLLLVLISSLEYLGS